MLLGKNVCSRGVRLSACGHVALLSKLSGDPSCESSFQATSHRAAAPRHWRTPRHFFMRTKLVRKRKACCRLVASYRCDLLISTSCAVADLMIHITLTAPIRQPLQLSASDVQMTAASKHASRQERRCGMGVPHIRVKNHSTAFSGAFHHAFVPPLINAWARFLQGLLTTWCNKPEEAAEGGRHGRENNKQMIQHGAWQADLCGQSMEVPDQ